MFSRLFRAAAPLARRAAAKPSLAAAAARAARSALAVRAVRVAVPRRMFSEDAAPAAAAAAAAPAAPAGRPARTPRVNNDKPTITGPREKGTVKWFDSTKGFGFIIRENGEDLFVHFTCITGEGYRTLEEGQKVEFNAGTGRKGPCAAEVSVVA